MELRPCANPTCHEHHDRERVGRSTSASYGVVSGDYADRQCEFALLCYLRSLCGGCDDSSWGLIAALLWGCRRLVCKSCAGIDAVSLLDFFLYASHVD
jgi:hypothetical protein